MRKWCCLVAAGVVFVGLQAGSRAGDSKEAKELVAKAIKAAGGEVKLTKFQAGTCKAKASIAKGGVQINSTLDVTWQGWDQYHMVVAADFGGQAKNAVVVINGDQAWAKDADRNKVENAPKEAVVMISGMLSAMRMPQMLPALLDKEVKLSPLAEIKIGDRTALGIMVERKDRKEVSLYFDKETGLPAKSEIKLTDPSGKEQTFEFLYQEYKETGGCKHPMRIAIRFDNADVTMELIDVNAKGKVEADRFKMPE